MYFVTKGRLNDGRTISGVISGADPVVALNEFVSGNKLAASDLAEVKLTALGESGTAKIRAPKKKKETGATEADKAAGANQMAAVAREDKADVATPQANAPSPRRR